MKYMLLIHQGTATCSAAWGASTRRALPIPAPWRSPTTKPSAACSSGGWRNWIVNQ